MAESSHMFLIPVAGPAMPPLELKPGPESLTLGRHESCDLKVPPGAEGVSRYHARFRLEAGRWRVTDLGSRWGTLVNGMKLTPRSEMPLAESDAITILPWTFSLSSLADRRGIVSEDDHGASIVRTVMTDASLAISTDLLALLLEASASIHAAGTETELAERLIDVAVRGIGLPNATVLLPLNTTGKLQVIASRASGAGETVDGSFSRTLLAAAMDGAVAELSAAGGVASQSMIAMSVSAALCVPLMLGPRAAAFLYLDARSNRPSRVGSQMLRKNATEFAAALGRLGSLALANLKRIELAQRQLWLDGELRAAAAAQKWILPPRSTRFGSHHCVGESRAGHAVGGDFFDVFELPGGQLAVAIGDVSGKGIPASVLMTATQGFLHASLLALKEPALAVTALNRFISPRRPDERFVTLWVGILDPRKKELRYVDAGHGYAWFIGQDRSTERLGSGDGLPLGLDVDFDYVPHTVPISEHGHVLVVTDGIVEQFGQVTTASGSSGEEQFQIDRVLESVHRNHAGDIVAALFADVIHHAGTHQLADDATAVTVSW